MNFSSHDMTIRLATVLFGLFLFPLTALAHQPRIVEGGPVTVIEEPEISKAYYGELTGEPHVFTFNANEAIDFYMNVLVPDLPGAKKDVSAALINQEHPEIPLGMVGGIEATWEPFYEGFAQDNYYQTSPFRMKLPAGTYEIRIWSSNNDSVYSLAVGEVESFGFRDVLDAYIKIPQIKSFFFEKPAVSAFFTPFLGIPLLGFLLFSTGAVWVIQRKRRS